MLYSKLLVNWLYHVPFFLFGKGDPYSFWLLKSYNNNVQVIIYGDTNKEINLHYPGQKY